MVKKSLIYLAVSTSYWRLSHRRTDGHLATSCNSKKPVKCIIRATTDGKFKTAVEKLSHLMKVLVADPVVP